MTTKQRLIKICFEDLETGYVLATIPDTMNNSNLKWCFDCILKDLSEKDIINDGMPNIEWLCEMASTQFPECSFYHYNRIWNGVTTVQNVHSFYRHS